MQTLSFVDQVMHKAGTAAGMPVYMQGAMVYDPAKTENVITVEALAEHIAARLADFAILRKKLVQDPLHIGTMKLIDDAHFNPLNHIGHRVLPSPGDQETLAKVIGEFSAEPLDYDRPLWRIEIIEGLENGRMALVQKLSHATMDGTAAMKIFQSIFDAEPKPLDKLKQRRWQIELEPSKKELLSDALAEQVYRLGVQTPKGLYAVSKMAARYAGNLLGKKLVSLTESETDALNNSQVKRAEAGESPSIHSEPDGDNVKIKAPKTSLNCQVSRDRRVIAFQNYQLDQLKGISKALGCTLNDLSLAMISQAFVSYFDGIGEKVDGDIIVCMPLNMRSAGDESLGNALALSMINLRTTIKSVAERLQLISQATTQAKQERQNKVASPKKNYDNLIDMISPLVIDITLGALNKFNSWSKLPNYMNAIVSNVAGPREGMYFAGMPIDISIPMVPFFHTGALAIGVTSMGNTFSFGFHGCGRAVKPRNLHFLTDGLTAAYNEFAALAAVQSEAPTKSNAPSASLATPSADKSANKTTSSKSKTKSLSAKQKLTDLTSSNYIGEMHRDSGSSGSAPNANADVVSNVTKKKAAARTAVTASAKSKTVSKGAAAKNDADIQSQFDKSAGKQPKKLPKKIAKTSEARAGDSSSARNIVAKSKRLKKMRSLTKSSKPALNELTQGQAATAITRRSELVSETEE